MQRPHYSFRTSDMGALSDTSGNPAHITADNYEFHPSHKPEFLAPDTEPAPLVLIHQDGNERKFFGSLNTDGIDFCREHGPLWEEQFPAQALRAVSAPRARREAPMFASTKGASLAVAVALIAAVAFLALVLPNLKG